MLGLKSLLRLAPLLALLLLLMGCGVATASGSEGVTPPEPFDPAGGQTAISNTMPEKNVVAHPDPDIPLPGTTLPKGPQQPAPLGPHNKVEDGFQVGNVFVPEEVEGYQVVDILTGEDTPCIGGGVEVTVRAPADDLDLRRALYDLLADNRPTFINNVTEQVSNGQVYAANESRIQQGEQACIRRFAPTLDFEPDSSQRAPLRWPTSDGGHR